MPFVTVYRTFPDDPAATAEWMEMAREQGSVLILGVPDGVTREEIMAALDQAGLRTVGVEGGS